MHLRALPPKGWNVGPALVFIQVSNVHVHDMWGMPPVITEILVWEKIQWQRNKNRFRVGLGSCQNMSRNMLKNSLPIFFWHSEFWEHLRLSLKQPPPTPPEKAARGRKDSGLRKSHPLGGSEIQLLSHLTFPCTWQVWDMMLAVSSDSKRLLCAAVYFTCI